MPRNSRVAAFKGAAPAAIPKVARNATETVKGPSVFEGG
ncbi:MAG: hypothetical protein ACJAQW_002169 [Paracoccaceae bacterium]|jgi:hypothetical protein